MSVVARIESHIRKLEAKLTFIESQLANEMKKSFRTRNNLLMNFLYEERIRYEFALSEFKIILKEEECKF